MPMDATMQTWDDLSSVQINAKLSKSAEDIAADRICSQEELDCRMRGRFANGRHRAVFGRKSVK